MFALLTVIITGIMLVYGAEDFPKWGDPDQPGSVHVSPRYTQGTYIETGTPNIVTAVVADYRGYDTMGETTVIYTAGMACILMLRKKKRGEGEGHG
ncbi:MAG: hydrogen gas-evolving membrane-bound hydrogenase subunit E [Thermodesulfobacteriota bacterium]